MQTDERQARPAKPLPPAAMRARAEAEVRRASETADKPPTEIDGRQGPEPVRYGDWERQGRAIDF